MKLIKPTTEILEQEPSLIGIYKQIEIAGRTCYRSEDRINENSTKKFAEVMIKSDHGAMLEHGTVYLKVPKELIGNGFYYGTNWHTLWYNPYTKHKSDFEHTYFTTNYRVIIENDLQGVLEYLCEPTEYHEKRVTVRFSTDIGVTREANRHRVNSMAEQSTRYCNYSKEKFGGELSISLPTDLTEEEIHDSKEKFNSSESDCFHEMCKLIGEKNEDIFDIVSTWLFANLSCEWSYLRLLELGWKPQQARRVLPLDTHSELVHTAFVSDWKHFFDLRADGVTGLPHPDMAELAKPLKEEFRRRGYYGEM